LLKLVRYKPVKVMFDLEDEFQAKLYDYLKKRSNGSSYIRTLIHSDMTGVKQQIIYEPVIETKPVDIVVPEQIIVPEHNEVEDNTEDDIILDGIL